MIKEVIRDDGHYSPDQHQGIIGLAKDIPIQNEGFMGFIDQHIGSIWEMLAITYVSRLPVELVSRVVEAYSDKKVDPRLKMGISILLGVGITGAAEMGFIDGGNNVQDTMDLFGPIIGAVWAGGGAMVMNYLFSDKMKSVKSGAENKLRQLFRYLHNPRSNPEMMLSDFNDSQETRIIAINSRDLGDEG